MPKYEVLKKFRDAETKDIHEKGKILEWAEKRAEEAEKALAKWGGRFIKKIEEADEPKDPEVQEEVEDPEEKEVREQSEFPKHTGGGYYELSDGNKVQGKEKAEEAEKALEK